MFQAWPLLAIWLYAFTFLFHIVTPSCRDWSSRRGLALKANAPAGFDCNGAKKVLMPLLLPRSRCNGFTPASICLDLPEAGTSNGSIQEKKVCSFGIWCSALYQKMKLPQCHLWRWLGEVSGFRVQTLSLGITFDGKNFYWFYGSCVWSDLCCWWHYVARRHENPDDRKVWYLRWRQAFFFMRAIQIAGEGLHKVAQLAKN